MLLTAESVWQLYVGRVIGGVGGGIAFLVCPVYVAEISEVSEEINVTLEKYTVWFDI